MKRLAGKREPVLAENGFTFPGGDEIKAIDSLRESLHDGQLILQIGIGIFTLGVIVCMIALFSYFSIQAIPVP